MPFAQDVGLERGQLAERSLVIGAIREQRRMQWPMHVLREDDALSG